MLHINAADLNNVNIFYHTASFCTSHFWEENELHATYILANKFQYRSPTANFINITDSVSKDGAYNQIDMTYSVCVHFIDFMQLTSWRRNLLDKLTRLILLRLSRNSQPLCNSKVNHCVN